MRIFTKTVLAGILLTMSAWSSEIYLYTLSDKPRHKLCFDIEDPTVRDVKIKIESQLVGSPSRNDQRLFLNGELQDNENRVIPNYAWLHLVLPQDTQLVWTFVDMASYTRALKVKPNATIGDIKAKIEQPNGLYPVTMQRLFDLQTDALLDGLSPVNFKEKRLELRLKVDVVIAKSFEQKGSGETTSIIIRSRTPLTIDCIKGLIEEKTQIPSDEQRLICNGKTKSDDQDDYEYLEPMLKGESLQVVPVRPTWHYVALALVCIVIGCITFWLLNKKDDDPKANGDVEAPANPQPADDQPANAQPADE